MKRKTSLLGLLLASVVIATLSCSSGDKQEGDQASSDVAEATADATDAAAAADPANPDAANASDMAATDPAASTEQMPTDGAAADAAKDTAALGENLDPNAPANPDQAAADATPPADVPPADTTASTETPPADTTASTTPTDGQNNDLFGGAAATTGDAGTGEAKPKRALAHIKDKPFKKGGQLLNTVYLAREGDTVDSVSEKLFGENKSKMLKKSNPNIKNAVNPGDKIYFNSPNRPEDNEKMMTVYEDQGLPPASYTTKEGDTLKSLAMEWYGSEASYKEIYAINKNLSSTKELPAGTELQYWPSSVTVVAYNAKKAEPAVAEMHPPEPLPATTTPPPAMNTMPPAPAMGNMAMNNQPPGGANTLPPPPPDMNSAPLPPPPSSISKKKNQNPSLDNDTVMYAVAGGVLLIGGGAIAAIRRRSNKRNQGMTQI